MSNLRMEIKDIEVITKRNHPNDSFKASSEIEADANLV